MPINLSNNTEFTEQPQITISKNGLFIIWADTVNPNNKEIMFTKSLDNGKTFSKAINISNNSKNSYNQVISASDEKEYVVWRESDENMDDENGSIMFKSSIDSGYIFNNSK